jgi:hypothetical protein
MRVDAGRTTHGVKKKSDHRSGDRVATEIPESRSLPMFTSPGRQHP